MSRLPRLAVLVVTAAGLTAAPAVSLGEPMPVATPAAVAHSHHHKRKRRDPFPGAFTMRRLGTTIVPGAGVGALRFPTSVTAPQVLARYGRPPGGTREEPGIIRYRGIITTLRYENHRCAESAPWCLTGVTLSFDSDPANALNEIRTDSPTYATASGIRVGSSPGALRRAYPEVVLDAVNRDENLSVTDPQGHLIQTQFGINGHAPLRASGSRNVTYVAITDCTVVPVCGSVPAAGR